MTRSRSLIFSIIRQKKIGLFIYTLSKCPDGMRPGGLAEQSLRPYYLVFTAYAVAIVLVAAWAGSIAKRLSDVEDRLAE